MKCDFCGNEDLKYFGKRKDGSYYCRRCISFLGETADENFELNSKNGYLYIPYRLTEAQEKASSDILRAYKSGKNVLVYAVCGAGKTELVYKVILYTLQKGGKVGFAIPRRDVVIELAKRLTGAFKNYEVTSVYGGNTNLLIGDIICLTTHQLFRYPHYFDLLILDEIDAFPYKNNFVLKSIFIRSVKGNYVLMSATPSDEEIEEYQKDGNSLVTLFKRHHGKPIPVPKIMVSFRFVLIILLIIKGRKYLQENLPFLIFVGSIGDCETLYKFIKNLLKPGYFVHSKCKERKKIIDDFRDGKYKFLVTTAVLERGVTLKNLQVIVFDSDSNLYEKSTLIQIAGRVGRTKDAPSGEVIFMGKRKTKDMVAAIKEIERCNSML